MRNINSESGYRIKKIVYMLIIFLFFICIIPILISIYLHINKKIEEGHISNANKSTANDDVSSMKYVLRKNPMIMKLIDKDSGKTLLFVAEEHSDIKIMDLYLKKEWILISREKMAIVL